MSEPTEPEAHTPQQSVPRPGKRRRGLAALLVAAVAALLLHQPVLTAALRQIAIRRAARENVRLELEVGGTVWTRLTVRHLKATPAGSSPIETITIDELEADYSLPNLVRRGWRDFLTGYRLRNANLVLDAVRGDAQQKKKLARLLHDILQQPAMYSDRAQIEAFNLTLRTPEGIYRWEGVEALLDPDRPGFIQIDRMEIPRVGSWSHLYAPATYANRHLILRDFALGNEAKVARLELDASLRAKGVAYLSFEGNLFGGEVGLFLWQRERPGGRLEAQITASLAGLPLETPGRIAGWPAPPSGTISNAWLQIEGDPRHPAQWRGHSTLRIERAAWNGVAVDEISGKVTLRDGVVRIDPLQCVSGANRLAFSGELPVPRHLDPARLPPMEAAFELDAPELSRLHAAFTGGKAGGHGKIALKEGTVSVEGDLNAEGVQGGDFGVGRAHASVRLARPLGGRPTEPAKPALRWLEGVEGEAGLEAQALRFREFAARGLSFRVPVSGTAVRVEQFDLDLNDRDQVSGAASLSLKAPAAYDAWLYGDIQDLAVFQPFVAMPVAGALQVRWHGAGDLGRMRHTGEGELYLQRGRLGALTQADAALAGVYSPEAIDLTQFRLTSDQGTVQAGVRLRDQRLRVEDLKLTAGEHGTVTGSLTLPLDLRTPAHPETVLPAEGAIEGQLALAQIDLTKALPALLPNLKLRGLVDGSLTAGGTIGSPEIAVTVRARELQSPAAAKLAPASGAAALGFAQNRLALSGTFSQPGLEPLVFNGSMPLDLRAAIARRGLDRNAPFTLSLKLPPSPANLFAPLVPGIRYLEGRLAIDASASGTLEKPVFNGGMALELPAVRFQNADLPGVNRFQADLRFAGNELSFHRFSGDIAGGPFSVTGKISLAQPAAPVLDLRLESKGTLLARNDTLTLRADSDLRLQGALAQARVSGKVGINKSRFFREVDILPIGLPGRPAPKPARMDRQLSIDVKPFSQWSFDVAVRTSEPFVVKGNVANGNIQANLRLGGTGLAPTLEGSATIENFTASLPFSRLAVDHGALYFSGNQILNPALDIHGSSRIRDYNISVYLFGTASEPQTLFTSEPALPQEEIMALLATGATTRDFAQNNQALAGRAAVLLFQDLYRKIRPNRPAPSDNTHNPFDRFSLDVGSVDPRTGKQELMGRFKLSNQYEVGAGVDMQGDVRMQLRYLLRFR